MSRLYSIGDNIGLFPIAYAERLEHAAVEDSWSREEDLYILAETVDKGTGTWPSLHFFKPYIYNIRTQCNVVS